MSHILLTPRIGALSETFVHRHSEDLSTGPALAVVGREIAEPAAWMPSARVLVVDERRSGRRIRGQLRRLRDRHPASGRVTSWNPSVTARDDFAAVLACHPGAPLLAEFLDQWIGFVQMAHAAGHRCVVHGHGYDVSTRMRSPHWRDRYRQLSQWATIVVVTEFARQRLVDQAGIDEARVEVAPCGVSIPPAPVAIPPTEGTLRLATVGRLVGKKDPRPLLTAVGDLRRRGLQVELDLVGTGPLERQVARHLRHDREAADGVTVHGALSHRQALEIMERSHACLFNYQVDASTGEEEGLPVTLLEAMAIGRPVVVTRHAGVPEAVDGEGFAWLVAEGDATGFTVALSELAEATHGELTTMGSAAHRVAAERFSISRELQVLDDLLFESMPSHA
jgi:colanic acid/amylovoran biosynthesis glycosyltransferase